MAKVSFQCEKCGKHLRADSAHAGRSVRCPGCGARLVVPALESEQQLGAIARSEPAPPPAPHPTGGTPRLSLAELRDPRELAARTLLIVLAVPAWCVVLGFIILSSVSLLVFIGLSLLAGYMVRLFMLAYIKINAVRASPRQFPEIYAAATEASNRLGIARPDVYVLQEGVWNAFAAKLAGKRIVVLFSGAVDAILLKGDMAQVAWLVGHEIGHHAAGHLGVWNALVRMGGWFPWARLWYERRAELTCDRIGLYVAGSAASSIRAVGNMAVGAQLADQLNTEEAIDQWDSHQSEFFVRYRVLYSTHPPHLYRLKRLVESARELGVAA